jgi:hypothetical protein
MRKIYLFLFIGSRVNAQQDISQAKVQLLSLHYPRLMNTIIFSHPYSLSGHSFF